jgi:predicted transcriptional regulator
LRDAGTWGERLSFPLPEAALARAAESGSLELRLEVGAALPGGLAIYGRRFGRYPMDPTLVFAIR